MKEHEGNHKVHTESIIYEVAQHSMLAYSGFIKMVNQG